MLKALHSGSIATPLWVSLWQTCEHHYQFDAQIFFKFVPLKNYMRNNVLLGCLVTILIIAVSSCKKTTDDPILEPIAIVSPDSTIVFVGRGKTQKITQIYNR